MTDLHELTATRLRQRIADGEVSCREVLDAHIARIEAVNPTLNAIVTTAFERAAEAADALDASGEAVDASGEAFHAQGGGALGGLPIAHKDLVATRGIRTTMGSPLHADDIPDHDQLIVTRMREAGAITIGKTNTPEFGAGSHTFNRVFGATKNPYDTSKTCGGSSGGAAVALASRMIPIADGSDMGGSLRNPAAFCNVVGFRPSPGRVPTWPDANPWFDLATNGPMARTVDDAALLFSVLAGPDPRIHNMQPEPGGTFYPVEPMDLKGLKIALSYDFGGLPVASAITERLRILGNTLIDAGAIVVEASPDLSDARRIFHILRATSFRRFTALSDEQQAELKDTIIWNLREGLALTNDDYDWVYPARSALIARMGEFFERFDLLIGPTTQVLPFDIDLDWVREIEGTAMHTYIEWMESCSLVTTTACPAISLPAGFAEGAEGGNSLPVGAQLIAPLRADGFLLRAAKAVEAITGYGEQPPPL